MNSARDKLHQLMTLIGDVDDIKWVNNTFLKIYNKPCSDVNVVGYMSRETCADCKAEFSNAIIEIGGTKFSYLLTHQILRHDKKIEPEFEKWLLGLDISALKM